VFGAFSRSRAMEEKIKAALANVDRVISSVNMNRKEHMVLVENIELLTTVGKGYLKLLKDNEDKKDEPAN
jgi:predicted aspartyl protease